MKYLKEHIYEVTIRNLYITFVLITVTSNMILVRNKKDCKEASIICQEFIFCEMFLVLSNVLHMHHCRSLNVPLYSIYSTHLLTMEMSTQEVTDLGPYIFQS